MKRLGTLVKRIPQMYASPLHLNEEDSPRVGEVTITPAVFSTEVWAADNSSVVSYIAVW